MNIYAYVFQYLGISHTADQNKSSYNTEPSIHPHTHRGTVEKMLSLMRDTDNFLRNGNEWALAELCGPVCVSSYRGQTSGF